MRSVRAATALDRHSHASATHQQRHDREQHGSRSTSQRQLSDILHVQHGSGGIRSGVIDRLDLTKGILFEVTRPSSVIFTLKVTLKFWA